MTDTEIKEPEFPRLSRDITSKDAFDTLKVLRDMKRLGLDDPARPDRLPVMEIRQLPQLFQARGMDGIEDSHVRDLYDLLMSRGELTPIAVYRCGGETVLLDGHHRLRAYRWKARKNGEPALTIPVQWHEGDVVSAFDAASDSHNQLKLPLTPTQRSNHAWMLVCHGIHSKKQQVKLSGLSERTIANMRMVKGKLLEQDLELPSLWSKALASLSEREFPEFDWDAENRLKGKKIAAQWRKIHGPWFLKNPDAFVFALEEYWGGQLPRLTSLLGERLGDEFDPEDFRDEDEDGGIDVPF